MSFIDEIKKMMNNVIKSKNKKTSTNILLEEFVKEAEKWIGVSGDEGIDSFRKAIDGKAEGEPWCAAFVQYCARATSIRMYSGEPDIVPSELCYDIWVKSPKELKETKPRRGLIVIWNYPGTYRGHTGIVTGVNADGTIETIEGNTTVMGEYKRDGRGVYAKVRSQKGMG